LSNPSERPDGDTLEQIALDVGVWLDSDQIFVSQVSNPSLRQRRAAWMKIVELNHIQNTQGMRAGDQIYWMPRNARNVMCAGDLMLLGLTNAFSDLLQAGGNFVNDLLKAIGCGLANFRLPELPKIPQTPTQIVEPPRKPRDSYGETGNKYTKLLWGFPDSEYPGNCEGMTSAEDCFVYQLQFLAKTNTMQNMHTYQLNSYLPWGLQMFGSFVAPDQWSLHPQGTLCATMGETTSLKRLE